MVDHEVTVGSYTSSIDTIAVRHNIRFLAYPSQKFKPSGNIYSLESPLSIELSADLGFKDGTLMAMGIFLVMRSPKRLRILKVSWIILQQNFTV